MTIRIITSLFIACIILAAAEIHFVYIDRSGMTWNNHYLRVSHCVLYTQSHLLYFMCVHKCVLLEWATAADGAKRYRLQLHLLWLPYELNKKPKKKNYRRPTTVWILLQTAVTQHYSHPSLVRGVSDIVRIIVYNTVLLLNWYLRIPKNSVSQGVGNSCYYFDRI